MTKFEFSAGGVVFRKEDDKILILVAQHSAHHGWVFPKGLIGDVKEGETKEETAQREVLEETGTVGKILVPLQPISYFYVFGGQKIRKTVYYFLMDYIDGNITQRDQEMEKVEWLPLDEVEERLTYKGDKQVWQEAKKKIEEL